MFVASVSPQVRASIAATYGVSEQRAGWMIEQLLGGPVGLAAGGRHGNAFTWIVDTNAMREVCLVLSADEVVNSTPSSEPTTAPTPSQPRKPILTSACPGWICYAEKTHPHVLPYLSRLKSPQALTGTLLKTVLSKRLGISPNSIWHLAVMPCFDKKLEASREELTDVYWRSPPSNREPTAPVRDVDCVITARELLMLADTRGISFPSLPQTPLPVSSIIPFPDPVLNTYLFPRKRPRRNQDPAAGPSGGYLHHVLQTHLSSNPGGELQTTRGRNADVVEYAITRPTKPLPRHNTTSNPVSPTETSMEVEEGEETIFKAARYYGFRNIQNLVRKLKPPRPKRLPGAAIRPGSTSRTPSNTGVSKTPTATATAGGTTISGYSYIEVMACPGGCTNGGGQIKVDDLGLGQQSLGKREGMSQKEWLARVDEAYFSMPDDGDISSSPEISDHNEGTDAQGDTDMLDAASEDWGIGARDEGGRKDFINGINVPEIKAMLHHWSTSTGIELEKLCYTSFRAVESDVGKSDKSQDRVVELAGRISGGW